MCTLGSAKTEVGYEDDKTANHLTLKKSHHIVRSRDAMYQKLASLQFICRYLFILKVNVFHNVALSSNVNVLNAASVQKAIGASDI